MLTILQLSDIHFKRLSDAWDEYTQLKERLFEKVEEICKSTTVDCILICGDVAFSGNQEEYEQKAKPFIEKLQELTGCDNGHVYVVPGNHDKNRDAGYACTRVALRDAMLKDSTIIDARQREKKIYDQFFNIYKDENDTFVKWLLPFEDYVRFANDFICVSEGVAKTRSGQERTYSDKLYWNSEDLKVGPYTLCLHGINSCYVSDWEDDKHEQILPKELYKTTKRKATVNVSVMHHPLWFMKDKDEITKEMDTLYPIQFYGHIHNQTIENNGTLKIFSGAIMPPKGEGDGGEDYRPVFNVIKFEEGQGEVAVTIEPYKWAWTSKDDGRFNAEKAKAPYHVKVDDANMTAAEQEKPLKLPVDMTQRGVEVEFVRSGRMEDIMKKMYTDFELHNDPVADASTFFGRVERDDRYEELYNYIHNK